MEPGLPWTRTTTGSSSYGATVTVSDLRALNTSSFTGKLTTTVPEALLFASSLASGIKNSIAGLSADHRLQAVLIAFAFGAFLEGAAGGGTPVAICAAMMVGLGFNPFLAAGLCLIANTSPVAYGGFGTPLLTLQSVTNLDVRKLSHMAGNQLPFLSCIIPFWLVRCMCGWRETREVLPAIAVAGGSFALCQFVFAQISRNGKARLGVEVAGVLRRFCRHFLCFK